MFIGHYAVALGAKRVTPRVSLGTLFLATQLIDLLWPIFLLLGLEHVRIDPGNTLMTPLDFYDYPITHSALGALLWAGAIGGAYLAIKRSLRSATIVALVAFSHWLLDLISHRPDLPLFPGGTARYGFGLWNSFAGSLLVEVGLFVAGIWLYARATRPKDRAGRYGFWALVALLGVIHAGNVFGPPPPDVKMIAYAGHALWLFVLWAYWVDRHREARRPEAKATSRAIRLEAPVR
jgi:hypothetical protein